MRRLIACFLLVAALVAGSVVPTHAQSNDVATDPETLVRNQVDALMTILDDTRLIQPENREELESQLIAEFEDLFVFDEMTRRALGAHARSLDEDQLNELSGVFEKLLKEIYVSRLTSHLSAEGDTAEIVSIELTGTQKRGRYAKVNSVATFRKGEETTTFEINYKMVNRGEGWHIYDVEIEGVSLISNYRSQFANVLTNNSYETLVEQLREKLDQKRQTTAEDLTDTAASSS
jgi:phospholipid transport system substrate-binding protein